MADNNNLNSGEAAQNDVIKVTSKQNQAVYALENLKKQFDRKLFCDLDLISALDQTK